MSRQNSTHQQTGPQHGWPQHRPALCLELPLLMPCAPAVLCTANLTRAMLNNTNSKKYCGNSAPTLQAEVLLLIGTGYLKYTIKWTPCWHSHINSTAAVSSPAATHGGGSHVRASGRCPRMIDS